MADEFNEKEFEEFKKKLSKKSVAKKGGLFERFSKSQLSPFGAVRGIRGLAVGLENVSRPIQRTIIPGSLPPTLSEQTQVGQRLGTALERASEAVRPGFEPQGLRENIASTVGTVGAETALMAPIAALGGVTKLKGLAGAGLSLLRGGVTGATVSALDQGVDRGNITIDRTLPAVGFGVAFPIVAATPKYVGRAIRGFTRFMIQGAREFPNKFRAQKVLEKGMSVFDEFQSNPQKVNNLIKTAQAKLAQVHGRVVNQLNKTREKIGLGRFVDDDIVLNDPNFKPSSLDDLSDRFELFVKQGDKIDPKIRLKNLIELKQKLNRFVRWSKRTTDPSLLSVSSKGQQLLGNEGNASRALNAIDDAMLRTPGGREQVVMNKAYSESKNTYEKLLKKLSNEDTVDDVIQKIIFQDFKEAVGFDKANINILRRAEKMTNSNFIGPLRKQFALKDLEESTVRGNIRGAIAGIVASKPVQGQALRLGQVAKDIGEFGQRIATSGPSRALTSSILEKVRE